MKGNSDKLVLFHGTNKILKFLRADSFLTTNISEAVLFSKLKEGEIVYQVSLSKEDVYYDIWTPSEVRWFILCTKIKLTPENSRIIIHTRKRWIGCI